LGFVSEVLRRSREDKATAELTGKAYTNIIAPEFQWSVWATPKKDGNLDHHAALTGMISRLCKRKTLPLPQEFKADALTQIPLSTK
jgi:type I restriction enzyme M protein